MKRVLQTRLGALVMLTLVTLVTAMVIKVCFAFNSPTSEETRIVLTNGWNTYTDTKAGYSFDYPQDAHLSVSHDADSIYNTINIAFELPMTHGYQGMVIRVEDNPEELSIDRLLVRLYMKRSHKTPPSHLAQFIDPITVSGMPAFRTCILPDVSEFHVFILHGAKVYDFAPVHDAAANMDAKALSLFYQVLSTFTLNP